MSRRTREITAGNQPKPYEIPKADHCPKCGAYGVVETGLVSMVGWPHCKVCPACNGTGRRS